MSTVHAAVEVESPAHRVLRRLFDEGFATGETAIVDEVVSPDLVEHQFGLQGSGREAVEHLKDAIRDVYRATPGMEFSIEDSVESGDTIWARVRARGTNTGPFFGPPSNQPVEITVIDVCRIADGRIVEHWGVPDRFALLAQTGVLGRLSAAGGGRHDEGQPHD